MLASCRILAGRGEQIHAHPGRVWAGSSPEESCGMDSGYTACTVSGAGLGRFGSFACVGSLSA